MTLRIISSRPIDLVYAAVRQNLGEVWVESGAIDPFMVKGSRIARISGYSESSLSNGTSPEDAKQRIRFGTNTEVEFFIWKVLAAPPGEGVMFLTMDALPLFAMQTDVSIRSDGILQLFGAEMGISLLTPKHLQDQMGKRLYKGESLRTLSMEEKDEGGNWQQNKGFQFTTSTDPIESIQLEPDQVRIPEEE